MRYAAIVAATMLLALGCDSDEDNSAPTLPATQTQALPSPTTLMRSRILEAAIDGTVLTYEIDLISETAAIAEHPPFPTLRPTPYHSGPITPSPQRPINYYSYQLVSPDGQFIADLRNDATTIKGLDTELTISKRDGSDARDLTNTPENEYSPISWTPDSKAIVFWRDTVAANEPGWSGSNAVLFKIDIASGQETPIGHGILQGASEIAWSPKSDRFAVISRTHSSTAQIQRILLVDANTLDVLSLDVIPADHAAFGNLRWDAAGEQLFVDVAPEGGDRF